MKFGVVIPSGNARDAARLARQAEESGWDGFFTWEAPWATDAWVSLTAAAMATSRIRLGTLLTPLPWLDPVRFAATTATLDDLSGGRLILAVGLGANDTGAQSIGWPLDSRTKAGLLDEHLAILHGLWRGQPFAFAGKHRTVAPIDFLAPPSPVQQPRIPTWCVGSWNRPRSMARVLRCDGVVPQLANPGRIEPADVHAIRDWLSANGKDASFDIVVDGESEPVTASGMVAPYVEAGATWWMETRWAAPGMDRLPDFATRIAAGPPRI